MRPLLFFLLMSLPWTPASYAAAPQFADAPKHVFGCAWMPKVTLDDFLIRIEDKVRGKVVVTYDLTGDHRQNAQYEYKILGSKGFVSIMTTYPEKMYFDLDLDGYPDIGVERIAVGAECKHWRGIPVPPRLQKPPSTRHQGTPIPPPPKKPTL